MDKSYEAVQANIRRARIERSAYLGKLVGEFLATSWQAIMTLVDSIGEGSQKRYRRSLFAVDA